VAALIGPMPVRLALHDLGYAVTRSGRRLLYADRRA
jgi:hypothetical protein